ncbi:restriction endonuclease subunit S [Enterococcus gallinarum]|uniref:restriction endonuclease subunit S n=1 Tax=Enterococcus gallinarum TaxID=1353 RepID=UPI000F4D8182|nr:restriction endonuclease subunit S [Enterococcus gallinarum]ROY84539.1 restriction endonuclease subunit S [Enterococcus gallinarum]
MSNDTQPEIRFPGFTDDWEQRKLGDFVVDYVEKTSVQNQFPMLTSSQQKGIVLQEDYFANRQVTTENNIGYFVLPRGYFTFRSRSDNDVFVFNRNDIIDRGIISYFYPVFTLKSADSDFFLRRINNGIQRQLSIQAEGTGQHVLSLKKFKNIVAMFPSEEEQQKIGTFFKQLDDTIALHQRKLDLLKETKKGFLQKMFPKNGAKVPEIRFPGFTEDWEQRKLGGIGKTYTGLTGKSKEDFGHGDAKFVTYMNVFQNPKATLEQLENVEIDPRQNEVKKGDVFFTTSSETPEEVGMSSVWTHDINNIYLNSFTFAYRPTIKFDLDYLAFMLRSQSVRKKIIFLAQGISRYNISKTKMMDISVPIPVNFEEQQKIGAFFKQLDDTIALHQRKLDLLKETKKGFLQKMFV